MTLEQISYLSQTIAAVAVVISLVYAALQFRIYTKAMRETRFVETSSIIQEFNKLIASDAEAARIFREGLTDMMALEPADRWRFDAMMKMLMSNMQFLEEFKDVEGRAHFLRQAALEIMDRPGAQQWWVRGRLMFPPSTVALIDRLRTEAKARAAVLPAAAQPAALPADAGTPQPHSPT